MAKQPPPLTLIERLQEAQKRSTYWRDGYAPLLADAIEALIDTDHAAEPHRRDPRRCPPRQHPAKRSGTGLGMTNAPESKPSAAQAITGPQNATQDRKHRPAEEHK